MVNGKQGIKAWGKKMRIVNAVRITTWAVKTTSKLLLVMKGNHGEKKLSRVGVVVSQKDNTMYKVAMLKVVLSVVVKYH